MYVNGVFQTGVFVAWLWGGVLARGVGEGEGARSINNYEESLSRSYLRNHFVSESNVC